MIYGQGQSPNFCFLEKMNRSLNFLIIIYMHREYFEQKMNRSLYILTPR